MIWQENSAEQTWVNRTGPGAFKVFGPVNLTEDYNGGGCTMTGLYGLSGDAIRAAFPDQSFSEYNRFVIIFPANGACGNPYPAIGEVGCYGNYSISSGH